MYNKDIAGNDLQTIITQALEDMKHELGVTSDTTTDMIHINLAELERRTGISRGKLRGLQKNGFQVKDHGNKGRKASSVILEGYTGVIDYKLRNNVTNSVVILDELKKIGYTGSISTVKAYIAQHKELVPPKRQTVAPQGSRGSRYTNEPGECYQMDWGFINVDNGDGTESRIACFAMVCHYCGAFYIEFFPNARQENLFIGMLHAFAELGIPEFVLTDNMKSVVLHRDEFGHPVWHPEYHSFMKAVGFSTKLCKPRHPFTKGAVERLIRYVKGNLLPGLVYSNITSLNYEAGRWCFRHNNEYHKATDCRPAVAHSKKCLSVARPLELIQDLQFYLCPERSISFDGFVNYEGRRFGVPYCYGKHTCRVKREDFTLYIYSDDLSKVLVQHNVTWSRLDSYCEGQFAPDGPEEYPTAAITTVIQRTHREAYDNRFGRFNFDKEVSC